MMVKTTMYYYYYCICTIILCIITTSQSAAPIRSTGTSLINGQYIVVLGNAACSTDFDDITTLINSRNAAGANVVKRSQTEVGSKSVTLSNVPFGNTDPLLLNIANLAIVRYIEQDGFGTAAETQTFPPNWGVDRIDQSNVNGDGFYSYPYIKGPVGNEVNVYVVDSGIDINHPEFGGRATWGFNAARDGIDTDCEGHGTNVAGIVGGTFLGVAKGVNLIAVKLIFCNGTFFKSDFTAAMDWVVAHKKTTGKPSIINLSLSANYPYQPMIDAAQNAIDNGLIVVAAAGNDNLNSCGYSPAGLSTIITVGAINNTDGMAEFSNWGSCVDILAPGVRIMSAFPPSINSYTFSTMSGTSQATPHVAGILALYLGTNPNATQAQAKAALIAAANTGTIWSPLKGSPNRVAVLIPPPISIIMDLNYGIAQTNTDLWANWKYTAGIAANDWIGLFKVGDASTAATRRWWTTLNVGTTSGTINAPAAVAANTVGQWEFRFFKANTFVSLCVSAPINVVSSTTTTLTAITWVPSSTNPPANKLLYYPINRGFAATWAKSGSGSSTESIALYTSTGTTPIWTGSVNQANVNQIYLPATAITSPGSYVLKFIRDGTVITTSQTINARAVSGNLYGATSNQYF